MWVITQEKDNLVFLRQFKVSKNIGGSKAKKYFIAGFMNGNTLDSSVVCAFYPTEEAALEQLLKIKAFMEENPAKVYIFE